MLPLFGNIILNASRRITTHTNIVSSSFHILCKPNAINHVQQSKLLVPASQNLIPSCGFKVMGKVRRRCKDCYLVRREERLFVICKTHPRHKQMASIKKPENTWILSHATQSKVRPW